LRPRPRRGSARTAVPGACAQAWKALAAWAALADAVGCGARARAVQWRACGLAWFCAYILRHFALSQLQEVASGALRFCPAWFPAPTDAPAPAAASPAAVESAPAIGVGCVVEGVSARTSRGGVPGFIGVAIRAFVWRSPVDYVLPAARGAALCAERCRMALRFDRLVDRVSFSRCLLVDPQ
jgi:hypothetical protein